MLQIVSSFPCCPSPRGSSFQRDKKMLTRSSPPLSRWSTLVIPHDGRIQSPLTSCGISCRRMAIVVRNPTCSRGEKAIRKQSPSSERRDFHWHVKAPFSKLRLVTLSLELFNKRVDELTLPLMPVRMTNVPGLKKLCIRRSGKGCFLL